MLVLEFNLLCIISNPYFFLSAKPMRQNQILSCTVRSDNAEFWFIYFVAI